MAFCKAIAIYREPIYSQFASGWEGAAGGGRVGWGGRGVWGGFGCLLSANRSLSCSSSVTKGDCSLTWQTLLVWFVPSGRWRGAVCVYWGWLVLGEGRLGASIGGDCKDVWLLYTLQWQFVRRSLGARL